MFDWLYQIISCSCCKASDKQIQNASKAMGSADKLWCYLNFVFSQAETGTKQYLSQCALLSLLCCSPNLLSSKLLVTDQASLEVFVTTLWGPAKSVSCHCSKRFLQGKQKEEGRQATECKQGLSQDILSSTTSSVLDSELWFGLQWILCSVLSWSQSSAVLHCEFQDFNLAMWCHTSLLSEPPSLVS